MTGVYLQTKLGKRIRNLIKYILKSYENVLLFIFISVHYRAWETSYSVTRDSRICGSGGHQLRACRSGHRHVEHRCHLLYLVRANSRSSVNLSQQRITLLYLSNRLSGESPFQGSTDAQTLALVTAAQWEFDPESFEDITDEAKDFISGLLTKDMR